MTGERPTQLDRWRDLRLAGGEGVPSALHTGPARTLLAEIASAHPTRAALDLGCGTGLVAMAAARAGAQVVAADNNLHYYLLTERNARLNDLPDVTVRHSDGFDHLDNARLEAVYFAPPPHMPPITVEKLIAESVGRLAEESSLYLALDRRSGGKRFREFAEGVFGAGARVGADRGREVFQYAGRGADPTVAARTAEALRRQEEGQAYAVVQGRRFDFRTRMGVFAWTEIDPGTQLLLDVLPRRSVVPRPTAPRRILDLGCGYGVLGIVAASLYPEAEVTMADVDRRALDLAEENARRNQCPNAHVVASDGFAGLAGEFDLILSNLPTHIGRRALQSLLTEARDRGGELVAVISRGLVVDQWARAILGSATTLTESNTHRVFRATKGEH